MFINMKLIITLLTIISAYCIILLTGCDNKTGHTISSPDGKILISVELQEDGNIVYNASYQGEPVLVRSRLGIQWEESSQSENLSLAEVSPVTELSDHYQLFYGKKKECSYTANKRIFTFTQDGRDTLQVIFQVSDDGFAFRYSFPGRSDTQKKITRELTSFNLTEDAKVWIQPRARSKTGWNGVNPSYEEHYLVDTLLSRLTRNDSGWVFPVLVHTSNCWVHLTESWPDSGYCGSHLNKGEKAAELVISFPEPTEGFTNGVVYPESVLPWTTPWRIVTLGQLSTIAESTLGTDMATPPPEGDYDYVKPGRASWSWALMKDPSVNYTTQHEFISYASKMGWEYCLIDVNWDTQIGWNKIKELAEFARSMNVGLILWYNSAGDWNTVPYHPKDLLLTTENRKKEFARLHSTGIKGVKVDFFGGDGQSMMDYYQDILRDAHAFQLMVNCHGATLPRGLQRTHPNLVSMESVRGFEYATFGQETAERVPVKSTILPFTRNTYDPMDFTPVCFNEYDNNHRITGNAAELAQAVLFLSGIQHYAETPQGMENVPGFVREMMSKIPVSWDETRYVDGYPGKYVVLARRTGNVWYIAGINAEANMKTFSFSLPFVGDQKAILITEGTDLRTFRKEEIMLHDETPVNLEIRPNGGFVIRTGP